MNALYLEKKARAESLVMGVVPRPRPNADEVLVKVHATAVMPTELDWFPTFHLPSGEPRPFPIILSHEFSGMVESLGRNVKDLAVGDAVYGLNDWFTNGAQAEYCVVAASALARKPRTLAHHQAAAVPISALTAWQGLFERTGLQSGQRILIHGASGGVGTFVVQLARRQGAEVIATASAANMEFVRSLGAGEVIDHRKNRFEEKVRNVDVVFDGVGGDTLQRSWDVLKPGGKLVTIASQYENSGEQRDRDAFMLVRADGAQLAEIAKLIDTGELRVFVEETFPLAKAGDAYARARQGGMRGKIALQVISE